MTSSNALWTGAQAVVFVLASALVITSGPRSVLGGAVAVDNLPGSPVNPAPESAGTASSPVEVDWATLAELNVETGEMSPSLARAVGGQVRVPGFMVPLEDMAGEVTEFLLVPYVGACVHTPPPPPNQLVYVQMAGARKVPVEWWNPIWVHGVLTVDETENVYGAVSFRLVGDKTTPYEW